MDNSRLKTEVTREEVKECGANHVQRKRQSDTEAGKVLKSDEQRVSGYISARLQRDALLVHLQQTGSKQAANRQQDCWQSGRLYFSPPQSCWPKTLQGFERAGGLHAADSRAADRAEAPVWQQQGQGSLLKVTRGQ